MNALLFNSTLAIYAAATVLYLGYLVKPKEILGRIAQGLVSVGFLVH